MLRHWFYVISWHSGFRLFLKYVNVASVSQFTLELAIQYLFVASILLQRLSCRFGTYLSYIDLQHNGNNKASSNWYCF